MIILLSIGLLYVSVARTTKLGQCIYIPVLCYHDILPDSKIPTDRKGENDPYTVTTTTFERDILYLLKRGYTPISMSDYISYSHKGKPIDRKSFLITIDDGNKSNILYALPILEKYQVPATLCLIGDRLDTSDLETVIENPYAEFLSSDDVRTLAKSSLIEFASHSNKMHWQDESGRKGTLMLEGETLAEYEKALLDDLVPFNARIKELTGKTCDVFTYPFGYVNISTIPILKKAGFKVNLTLGNVSTYYYGNEQELEQQRRFIRTNKLGTTDFFARVVGIS